MNRNYTCLELYRLQSHIHETQMLAGLKDGFLPARELVPSYVERFFNEALFEKLRSCCRAPALTANEKAMAERALDFADQARTLPTLRKLGDAVFWLNELYRLEWEGGK